jgi:hypothetical protein
VKTPHPTPKTVDLRFTKYINAAKSAEITSEHDEYS